jgi:hypothetical protein
MKAVVPAATRRAMYDRAVSAQIVMERWVQYLSTLKSEQSPPPYKGPLGLLVRPRPESITIPYAQFENLLYDLSQRSEEIKKFRKPVVQRPKI